MSITPFEAGIDIPLISDAELCDYFLGDSIPKNPITGLPEIDLQIPEHKKIMFNIKMKEGATPDLLRTSNFTPGRNVFIGSGLPYCKQNHSFWRSAEINSAFWEETLPVFRTVYGQSLSVEEYDLESQQGDVMFKGDIHNNEKRFGYPTGRWSDRVTTPKAIMQIKTLDGKTEFVYQTAHIAARTFQSYGIVMTVRKY